MKRYMKETGSEAQRLYHDPRFATPPGQDPSTLAGLAQKQQLAMQGSPVAQAAGAESARTLSGAYLDPATNPWLKTIADRAAGEAGSAVASRFAGSNRLGSGAYAGALADAEMGTRAALYGDAYNQERGRMGQAVASAPAAYGLGYADSGQLEDVGAARELEAQRQFDWPYELLNRYASVIYGNPVASQPGTKTTSQKGIGWMDILGGIGGALQPSMGGS
jgi:hypothetical protein